MGIPADISQIYPLLLPLCAAFEGCIGSYVGGDNIAEVAT